VAEAYKTSGGQARAARSGETACGETDRPGNALRH